MTRTSYFPLDPGDPCTLQYIVTHVFCPLQLPDGDDHSIHNDHSLAGAVASAARAYSHHVNPVNALQWRTISQMLDNLQATVQFQSLDRFQTSQLVNMNVGGGILSFHCILRLTTCRRHRISYPSSKRSGPV